MNTNIETHRNLRMCEFLAEYSSKLLGCGATCIRIEKNIGRIAESWGKQVQLTIMPRHVHVTLMDADGAHAHTVISSIAKGGISYELNTELSRMSWYVADHHIDFENAEALYHKTIKVKPANKWWVLFAASCANASFCRLFGGDAWAMAVVFLATAAGYYIKQNMMAHKLDVKMIWIVCAFISSILGAGASLFGLGDTPGIAIGTSVLYLVPGIPFINSFSDLLDGHYICSFSRFIDASILTACLSIGLLGGMALMQIGMF